jgi:hypothetical protein
MNAPQKRSCHGSATYMTNFGLSIGFTTIEEAAESSTPSVEVAGCEVWFEKD